MVRDSLRFAAGQLARTPRPQRLDADSLEPVAGDEDVDFAGDFEAVARSMHGAATGPAELLLVPSGHHSSALVTDAAPEVAERTRAAIVAFIEAHGGG